MRSAWAILYWSISQLAVAQTTFNVVQHHPSTLSYNGASAVFELEDGYLMFSRGWSIDSTSSAVHVTKFDLHGNQIWLKEHRRERDVSIGFINTICAVDSDTYAAGITEFANDTPNSTYLYWFNAEGDTIRTRFLKSDSAVTDANHGTRQLVALADGGFLHCGWCNTPVNTGCITRLDSSGSILWERVYPGHNYIHNAIELPDGGFVLGGSRNTIEDMAVVIRTDSMGEPEWIRYNGAYAYTGGMPALLTSEGDILTAGAWQPTQPGPGSTYDQWASLFGYDAQGVPIWRKDYFWSYAATNFFVLPKGEDRYWLVGRMFQYGADPDAVTLLWELDENCDSLWMRRFWHYESDGAHSFASCVRNTSDGGLVMCGATRQGVTDPLPYLQSNWLLKLDEHGCLEPGCQTLGVQDHVLGLNQYLRVWPNPVARGQPLAISFEPPPEFVLNGPLRVVVQDALGRVVHETKFQPGQLRTDNWATGTYHLHLTDNTRWLAGAKVVVQ